MSKYFMLGNAKYRIVRNIENSMSLGVRLGDVVDLLTNSALSFGFFFISPSKKENETFFC